MKRVQYRGKTYRVLANRYLGYYRLYKLASLEHWLGVSPFGALKTECKEVK